MMTLHQMPESLLYCALKLTLPYVQIPTSPSLGHHLIQHSATMATACWFTFEGRALARILKLPVIFWMSTRHPEKKKDAVGEIQVERALACEPWRRGVAAVCVPPADWGNEREARVQPEGLVRARSARSETTEIFWPCWLDIFCG